jgi:amino acid transporter
MTGLEQGEQLSRQLSAPQLAMIAIGGAIGTGLFLGSALAVRAAGPGVIITYVMGALIALLLMRALGEMAVVHPTAGSFGPANVSPLVARRQPLRFIASGGFRTRRSGYGFSSSRLRCSM